MVKKFRSGRNETWCTRYINLSWDGGKFIPLNTSLLSSDSLARRDGGAVAMFLWRILENVKPLWRHSFVVDARGWCDLLPPFRGLRHWRMFGDLQAATERERTKRIKTHERQIRNVPGKIYKQNTHGDFLVNCTLLFVSRLYQLEIC